MDDTELTQTIWYKQVKPNTHVTGGRHKDAIKAHASSCVSKEPHEAMNRIPKADHAQADVVA